MNKKGSMFDIIIWIVIALVVTLFLGIWLYAHNILTGVVTTLPEVVVNNKSINMSLIGQQTFGRINAAEQIWLPIIAFIIIVCEAMYIWVSNYFIKDHPLMFIPYVFVTAIAVVVAAIVSNVYQGLLSGLAFSAALSSMTMADYVLIYLPYWVGIIGAVGMILLLAQIAIPSGGGGSA